MNDINDLREVIRQRQADQTEPKRETLRVALFASVTLVVLVLVTALIF